MSLLLNLLNYEFTMEILEWNKNKSKKEKDGARSECIIKAENELDDVFSLCGSRECHVSFIMFFFFSC